MENNYQEIKISQEEVNYWKGEIEASRRFRKEEFIERIGYEKLIEYYEGFQRSDFQPSIEQMAIINEIYPAAESILTNTYYKNPSIIAKAKRPEADGLLQYPITFSQVQQPIELTDIMKSCLQHAADTQDLKTEAQLALFDFLFAGFACIEANHISTSQNDQYSDANDPNFIQSMLSKVSGALNAEDKVTSEQSEQGKDDRFDESYFMWWSPLDILFDYRAKTFKRSRYICKEKDYTIAEFKRDFPEFADKVPSTDAKPLKYAGHKSKTNTETVRVVETQIKKKDGLYILKTCDGIPEALKYCKSHIITNGFTVKYGCIDKYGKIYPISRVKLAKKPQDELNHYTTIQMEHADRSQKKVAVFVDGLNEKGRQAVLSSDPYAVVEKTVPGAVFESMPVGGVAPENKDLQLLNTENINKVIGTSELAKSGKSDSQFATQDAIKNQAFSDNTNAIEDALGDLIRQVLDCMKDIIMQFWDGEMFFKVTGKQGMELWYTPEMGKLPDILLGDYIIDIDITSARRPNPMQDRNEMAELISVLMKPEINMILQANGKRVSQNMVDELIKSFNKNPRTVLEDFQPQQPATPPMIGDPSQTPFPMPPEANIEPGIENARIPVPMR